MKWHWQRCHEAPWKWRRGGLDPLVVVGSHHLHAREASPLQGFEQLRPGGGVLGVGDLNREDLPLALGVYGDHQRIPWEITRPLILTFS